MDCVLPFFCHGDLYLWSHVRRDCEVCIFNREHDFPKSDLDLHLSEPDKCKLVARFGLSYFGCTILLRHKFHSMYLGMCVYTCTGVLAERFIFSWRRFGSRLSLFSQAHSRSTIGVHSEYIRSTIGVHSEYGKTHHFVTFAFLKEVNSIHHSF